MANVVVVGSQWGDEGKGKIVDWLSEQADIVVRFQGGHNAGHTLVIDGVTYKLSLIPTGVLRPGISCVIGNGVVVHPPALLKEIQTLSGQGVDFTGRLIVSDRAHVILPHHLAEERLTEESASSADHLGTTRRGIGPCYRDKVGRVHGVRVGDLFHPRQLCRVGGDEQVETVVQQCQLTVRDHDGDLDEDLDRRVEARHLAVDPDERLGHGASP